MLSLLISFGLVVGTISENHLVNAASGVATFNSVPAFAFIPLQRFLFLDPLQFSAQASVACPRELIYSFPSHV